MPVVARRERLPCTDPVRPPEAGTEPGPRGLLPVLLGPPPPASLQRLETATGASGGVRATSRHVTPRHAASRHITPRHVTPCHPTCVNSSSFSKHRKRVTAQGPLGTLCRVSGSGAFAAGGRDRTPTGPDGRLAAPWGVPFGIPGVLHEVNLDYFIIIWRMAGLNMTGCVSLGVGSGEKWGSSPSPTWLRLAARAGLSSEAVEGAWPQECVVAQSCPPGARGTSSRSQEGVYEPVAAGAGAG